MSFPNTAPPLRTAADDGRVRGFLAVAAASIELDPWPLPTMETEGCEVDGAPGRWGRVLWKAPDDRAVLLIEELEPCVLRGRHGGELLFLVRGRVRARPGDGSPEYLLQAGDVSWFEPGLRDEWVIGDLPQGALRRRGSHTLPSDAGVAS